MLLIDIFFSIYQVFVYVNKVGPYFNPHETYHYYQLPVCRPDTVSVLILKYFIDYVKILF